MRQKWWFHVEKIIKDGCHGVAIFGSTGAGQLISRYEKEKLIEEINNYHLINSLVKLYENNIIEKPQHWEISLQLSMCMSKVNKLINNQNFTMDTYKKLLDIAGLREHIQALIEIEYKKIK